MQLNRFMIRPYVEQALRDEIGPGDTTGGFLVGGDPVQTGQIYAKGDGVVCGLLLADETIKTVDPDAHVEHMADDGDDMQPGKILLKIRAKASTFFMIERCCLDWIQQMSGVATKTRRYVNLVKHTNVRVTDTRKGWPGLRMLQKYAVRVGGAHNHIFSLHNCVLGEGQSYQDRRRHSATLSRRCGRTPSIPSSSRSNARRSTWFRKRSTAGLK